jgi:hypothetical protein
MGSWPCLGSKTKLLQSITSFATLQGGHKKNKHLRSFKGERADAPRVEDTVKYQILVGVSYWIV